MGVRAGAVENLVMTDPFWRDRTVFITGHTGFKGDWLAVWLQTLEDGYAPPAPGRCEPAGNPSLATRAARSVSGLSAIGAEFVL